MSLIRSVHHIQFACSDLWNAYRIFTNGFGFHFHCLSKHGSCLNLVINNGPSALMLSNQGPPATDPMRSRYSFEVTNRYMQHPRPFDVAVEVTDVQRVCDQVKRHYGPENILIEPTVKSDYHGKVVMAVIRSFTGSFIHTLLDTSNYHGRFLPGFIVPDLGVLPDIQQRINHYKPVKPTDSLAVTHLDHIALAYNTGELSNAIKWFQTVFGMEQVTANSLDDPVHGFCVRYKSTGMRLKALNSMGSSDVPSTKFVLVEPLENSSPNQITRFLSANQGPGIQHLALGVKNIFDYITSSRTAGIQFVDPPASYYDQLCSSPTFPRDSINEKQLRSSGVLLDTEVLSSSSEPDDMAYLLQIFTSALFEPDAFFMEVIERHSGASGFGNGNITALWKALEASTGQGQRVCKRSV